VDPVRMDKHVQPNAQVVQPEQLPVRQEEFAVAVAAPARGFCS
jgi:putative hemolysin